jgi:hypothetical protein
MAADIAGALHLFSRANHYVTRSGLQAEIDWQRSVNVAEFSESDLLREAAWVILCSGFRESIVRRVFDYISLCFCDWESAAAIADADRLCVQSAAHGFRNVSKLQAILAVAHIVHRRTFPSLKAAILADPIAELSCLPRIGPITVWHLAKNLGVDVAKPDRHLARVASTLGYGSAADFCSAIAQATGEQIKVVDLIVWRYLADRAEHPVFSAA